MGNVLSSFYKLKHKISEEKERRKKIGMKPMCIITSYTRTCKIVEIESIESKIRN